MAAPFLNLRDLFCWGTTGLYFGEKVQNQGDEVLLVSHTRFASVSKLTVDSLY